MRLKEPTVDLSYKDEKVQGGNSRRGERVPEHGEAEAERSLNAHGLMLISMLHAHCSMQQVLVAGSSWQAAVRLNMEKREYCLTLNEPQ